MTPHTPAAPAMEYTIEQIAEIDNRIRKERKDERKQMLESIDKAIMKKETWSRLELLAIIAEQKSLRGGGTP